MLRLVVHVHQSQFVFFAQRPKKHFKSINMYVLDSNCNATSAFFHNDMLFRRVWYSRGKRQSKTLYTIVERGSEIDRYSVFDCHLSPIGRQMAFENSVSNDFFYLCSSLESTFFIAAYPVCYLIVSIPDL